MKKIYSLYILALTFSMMPLQAEESIYLIGVQDEGEAGKERFVGVSSEANFDDLKTRMKERTGNPIQDRLRFGTIRLPILKVTFIDKDLSEDDRKQPFGELLQVPKKRVAKIKAEKFNDLDSKAIYKHKLYKPATWFVPQLKTLPEVEKRKETLLAKVENDFQLMSIDQYHGLRNGTIPEIQKPKKEETKKEEPKKDQVEDKGKKQDKEGEKPSTKDTTTPSSEEKPPVSGQEETQGEPEGDKPDTPKEDPTSAQASNNALQGSAMSTVSEETAKQDDSTKNTFKGAVDPGDNNEKKLEKKLEKGASAALISILVISPLVVLGSVMVRKYLKQKGAPSPAKSISVR